MDTWEGDSGNVRHLGELLQTTLMNFPGDNVNAPLPPPCVETIQEPTAPTTSLAGQVQISKS